MTMAIFEKPPKRTVTITFKATPEEQQRLEAAAASRKQSVSDFIRNALDAYAEAPKPLTAKTKKRSKSQP